MHFSIFIDDTAEQERAKGTTLDSDKDPSVNTLGAAVAQPA